MEKFKEMFEEKTKYVISKVGKGHFEHYVIEKYKGNDVELIDMEFSSVDEAKKYAIKRNLRPIEIK